MTIGSLSFTYLIRRLLLLLSGNKVSIGIQAEAAILIIVLGFLTSYLAPTSKSMIFPKFLLKRLEEDVHYFYSNFLSILSIIVLLTGWVLQFKTFRKRHEKQVLGLGREENNENFTNLLANWKKLQLYSNDILFLTCLVVIVYSSERDISSYREYHKKKMEAELGSNAKNPVALQLVGCWVICVVSVKFRYVGLIIMMWLCVT